KSPPSQPRKIRPRGDKSRSGALRGERAQSGPRRRKAWIRFQRLAALRSLVQRGRKDCGAPRADQTTGAAERWLNRFGGCLKIESVSGPSRWQRRAVDMLDLGEQQ